MKKDFFIAQVGWKPPIILDVCFWCVLTFCTMVDHHWFNQNTIWLEYVWPNKQIQVIMVPWKMGVSPKVVMPFEYSHSPLKHDYGRQSIKKKKHNEKTKRVWWTCLQRSKERTERQEKDCIFLVGITQNEGSNIPNAPRDWYIYLPWWWFQICFIFTPKIGEMIQFHEHILQMGWFNHQPATFGWFLIA